MRSLFGILGILLVVLVVALSARQQLDNAAPAARVKPAGPAPLLVPDTTVTTPPPQEAEQIQQVQRALDQAAAGARSRLDSAEKAP